jgi:transposase
MQTASNLSRDEMERRRLAAARDHIGGRSQASVAREFGVSRTTASRWQKALNGKGLENLRKRRATGRPCRLTQRQRAEIVEMFAAGPQAMGLDGERWTTVRLAEAIARRFSVRYDPDHVGRLMHRLGLRKREQDAAPAPLAYMGQFPATAYGFSDIPTTMQ